MNLKSVLKRIIPVSLAKFQRTLKKQKAQLKEQKKIIDKQSELIEKLLKKQENTEKKLAELSEKHRRTADDFYRFRRENSKTASTLRMHKAYIDGKIKDERAAYYEETISAAYIQELTDWFFGATGEELPLDTPKTYNQKIQWLKIYDSTPIKTRLTDKYLVREWVKEKIGEKYLTRLLGVYDSFDEIDFSQLPERFVLKANHGCGYNYIVPDKAQMNISDARRKFHNWLKTNYAYRWGMEPQYRNIQPKIIAEEYLENGDRDLWDYKIWCFGGEPKYIQFLSERNVGGLKMAFYDTQWNRMPFVYDHPQLDHDIEKPSNLDEMLELAKTLSADFCHVRVDLYRLNDGTLKFGEMTFTSCSGTCGWEPSEYNEILGSLMPLPEKQSLSEE